MCWSVLVDWGQTVGSETESDGICWRFFRQHFDSHAGEMLVNDVVFVSGWMDKQTNRQTDRQCCCIVCSLISIICSNCSN